MTAQSWVLEGPGPVPSTARTSTVHAPSASPVTWWYPWDEPVQEAYAVASPPRVPVGNTRHW